MKRPAVVLAASLTCLLGVTLAEATELYPQRMGLSVWGNGFNPVSGNFGPSLKTKEAVQNGSSAALAWQYYPWRSFGFQAGYEFGSMSYEKEYRYEAGKTPNLVVQQITVAGLYNFSNMLGANARIRPVLSAGLGLYPLRVTEDGRTGETEKLANGKEFSKTSFGWNGGAGVEVLASNHLSIFGGGRYHYLFSKDDDKFGAKSNFGNQGFVSLGLGLSYHFSYNH